MYILKRMKREKLVFFISFILFISQANAGREIDDLGETMAFTAMKPEKISKEMVKDFMEVLEKKKVVSGLPKDLLKTETDQLDAASMYESLVKQSLGLEDQFDLVDFSSSNYSNIQKLVFFEKLYNYTNR